MWAARGGHGATTVTAALSVFWETSVAGDEPWVKDWILGTREPVEAGDWLPILDAGVIRRDSEPAATDLVILRGPCSIGLRSLRQHVGTLGVLVVVREPWRTISNEDVESVLDQPVKLEIPFTERIARLSDAGLLGARLEALDEFDSLRTWALRETRPRLSATIQ